MANLSLVGLSSGVEILCKSVPSGFHVETFVRLNIEMMAITNCTGSEKISLSLLSGLDMSLNTVAISGYDTIGLVATNVLGCSESLLQHSSYHHKKVWHIVTSW